MNKHSIKAAYDENTITIYQAYNKNIALSAVLAQSFISPPFKMDRMTWIKPSFLWMMYRSKWAESKGQEHILSIKMKRKGFNWALENSCLTSFNNSIHASHEDWKSSLTKYPVRVQWDPERDITLQPTSSKTIQVGLSGIALEKYVSQWITEIKDITSHCKYIHNLVEQDLLTEAEALLPIENTYPFPDNSINKFST